MKYVLVTGGSGYIGSHTLVQLIEHGYSPVVFDNFCNSSLKAIKRVEIITGSAVQYVEGDLRNFDCLNQVFESFRFDSVIHFAGLKSVPESINDPFSYYENNVYGSLQLVKAMSVNNVKKIVFSSSATVYGTPLSLPLNESMPTGNPTNPYGMTKLMVERILSDLFYSDDSWSIVNLRYFNPVGSHPSGLIGEDPSGPPNNLMPFISQTAIGKRDQVSIFGGDYETHDGTGVRDYIHVVDLATGHIKALEKAERDSGIWAVNLGTGIGYSVLDIVKAFEKASGKNIPFQIVERRPGDVASCYADPRYAKDILNWEAKFGLLEMCEDVWRWQSMNPDGY
mgnify:CR=1 FL=1